MRVYVRIGIWHFWTFVPSTHRFNYLVYVSNKGLSILLFHLLSAFYPLVTSRISLAIICGFCNLANLVISKHYHLQKRKEKDASVALRWTLPLGRVVYLRPHSGTIQFSLCVESALDTESDRWIHTIFNSYYVLHSFVTQTRRTYSFRSDYCFIHAPWSHTSQSLLSEFDELHPRSCGIRIALPRRTFFAYFLRRRQRQWRRRRRRHHRSFRMYAQFSGCLCRCCTESNLAYQHGGRCWYPIEPENRI